MKEFLGDKAMEFKLFRIEWDLITLMQVRISHDLGKCLVGKITKNIKMTLLKSHK